MSTFLDKNSGVTLDANYSFASIYKMHKPKRFGMEVYPSFKVDKMNTPKGEYQHINTTFVSGGADARLTS